MAAKYQFWINPCKAQLQTESRPESVRGTPTAGRKFGSRRRSTNPTPYGSVPVSEARGLLNLYFGDAELDGRLHQIIPAVGQLRLNATLVGFFREGESTDFEMLIAAHIDG